MCVCALAYSAICVKLQLLRKMDGDRAKAGVKALGYEKKNDKRDRLRSGTGGILTQESKLASRGIKSSIKEPKRLK